MCELRGDRLFLNSNLGYYDGILWDKLPVDHLARYAFQEWGSILLPLQNKIILINLS
jgi:hypothetical protein